MNLEKNALCDSYIVEFIHDANDMQRHKLGDATFDEYDIFCPPSFDEKFYYEHASY